MKNNISELKRIYRHFEQLILSHQDDEIIKLLEIYCSSEYSFSIRRMILNVMKPVSEQSKFQKYCELLQKSLEQEIGKKLY